MIHQIGFIGLGTMGLPMATHLVNRGFRLKLYARRPEIFATEAVPLIANGAIACDTISSVCKDIDILITNVTDTQDVESILVSNPDSAIQLLKRNSLVIDHSTIDPDRTRWMAKKLKKSNINMVDAPVSGGSIAAQSGQLVVMMGGEKSVCDRAAAIVSAYAKSITRVGINGHGQIAKLCNQIAQTITIEGIAESLLFAKSLGADPSTVLSAIEGGMGGSPMMTLLGPKMVNKNYDPVIEARLHAKDVGIACKAAEDHGGVFPCLNIVRENYTTAMERNFGQRDTSILHKIIDEVAPRDKLRN